MFAQLTLRRSQNLDKVEVLKSEAGIKQTVSGLTGRHRSVNAKVAKEREGRKGRLERGPRERGPHHAIPFVFRGSACMAAAAGQAAFQDVPTSL